MSLGAMQAGIEVALAVEVDQNAALTYRHNHPRAQILVSDVRKLSSLDFKGVRSRRRERILFGGPPCQGFSYSNQKTRNSSNPSNWLYSEFIRVAGLLAPDWVVFENVKGITDTEGGVFLRQVIEGLDCLGYTLTYGLLDAVDFGVPQSRKRLFIVGSRSGKVVDLPLPIRANYVSVAEAIGDLPPLQNGASISWMPYGAVKPSNYASELRGALKQSPNHLVTRNAGHVIERYRHIPPGSNWESIPADLMSNYKNLSGCHTGLYRRLQSDRPSIVIGNFRKNMLIHPESDRSLSVREAARLQSFPDTFEFKGSIGFQQQQVGNAVPPMLARAVFSKILHTIYRSGSLQ